MSENTSNIDLVGVGSQNILATVTFDGDTITITGPCANAINRRVRSFQNKNGLSDPEAFDRLQSIVGSMIQCVPHKEMS